MVWLYIEESSQIQYLLNNFSEQLVLILYFPFVSNRYTHMHIPWRSRLKQAPGLCYVSVCNDTYKEIDKSIFVPPVTIKKKNGSIQASIPTAYGLFSHWNVFLLYRLQERNSTCSVFVGPVSGSHGCALAVSARASYMGDSDPHPGNQKACGGQLFLSDIWQMARE